MSKIHVVQDSDAAQYHIGLSRRMIEGAQAAVIPGAPERAALIASRLDGAVRLASHRGLDSWLGRLDGTPLLVTNTGMGGPTTEIVVQELIQLGVETFLRIGTCGSIREEIPVGALIVSEAAIRLDGTSEHYAPLNYPAAADVDMVMALRRAAKAGGAVCFSGLTVSSATFFPGQERYDSASGYVPRTLRGSLEEWRALGALNYEMESATLFTICRVMGLRAGCLCAVVANRAASEKPERDKIGRAEEQAARVGLLAMKEILAFTPDV